MYSVSKEYLTAIRGTTRTDRISGKITLTNGTVIQLDNSGVIAGSVSVDNQCVSGQELAFGSVYMGQAALQLRTELSSVAFYDAALELDYQLQLSDGSWYALPIGRYTVAEAERTATVVSLTAYDNMLKLEKTYAGTVLQGDAYTMLGQIASVCGVTLGQTEKEIKALSANAEITRQLDGSYHVSTWRDCAGAIAQLLAGFATIDRLGRLVIRQFAESPCATLGEDARNSAKISDFSCHYAALRIETDTDTFTAETDGDDGLEMSITDMPLAESGTAAIRQKICDALFAKLTKLDYTPATVTLPGDPAIELGDRLTLPGKNGEAETLVTHLVWKFRGAATLKGVGKNPYLAAAVTHTDAKLRSLQKQADSNKMIYYSFTNSAALTVDGSREVNAATLTFVTTQDTSAMFLAQVLLEAAPETETVELPVVYDTASNTAPDTSTGDDADEPVVLPEAAVTLTQDKALTLTVRYYLDDSLIDEFSPTQRLVRGGHTLALFYPFPELVGAASHRWSVRLLCAGGKVTIGKGQIKATITGQGMSAADSWDGTITAEDAVGSVSFTVAKHSLSGIAASLENRFDGPSGQKMSEALATVAYSRPTITIS